MLSGSYDPLIEAGFRKDKEILTSAILTDKREIGK
jgi:hypothetical protein